MHLGAQFTPWITLCRWIIGVLDAKRDSEIELVRYGMGWEITFGGQHSRFFKNEI